MKDRAVRSRKGQMITNFLACFLFRIQTISDVHQTFTVFQAVLPHEISSEVIQKHL